MPIISSLFGMSDRKVGAIACAHFNGSTEYLYATDANFPESGIVGDMTVQAWVKVDAASVSAINDIVRKLQTAGQYCYAFRFTTGGKLRFFVSVDGTATAYMTSTGVIAEADTWVHVAVTYDASGGTCIFYKNGGAVPAGGSLPNSIFDGTSMFTLASHIAAQAFDGGLSRVAIFDDIRTPAEILASATTRGEDLSAAGNIIGFWPLDDLASATQIDNAQGDAGRDLSLAGGDTTNYGTHTRAISKQPV